VLINVSRQRRHENDGEGVDKQLPMLSIRMARNDGALINFSGLRRINCIGRRQGGANCKGSVKLIAVVPDTAGAHLRFILQEMSARSG
jgi:hypothetical protein